MEPRTVPDLAHADFVEKARLAVKWVIFHALCAGQAGRYLQRRGLAVQRMAMLGLYERKYLRALPRFVNSGDVVLDVGANYGVYTRALSRLVGPEGRVVAFEPLRCIFETLEHAVAASSNVILHNVALSNVSSQEMRVHVPLLFGQIPEPALASLHEVHGAHFSEIVRTARLDDIIDGAERIAFIKVDIEGHEKAFLEGAEETIRRGRPVIQIEENHPERLLSEHGPFCERLGYRICFLERGVLREVSAAQGKERNFYLVPEER